jgi:hypothetical protein
LVRRGEVLTSADADPDDRWRLVRDRDRDAAPPIGGASPATVDAADPNERWRLVRRRDYDAAQGASRNGRTTAEPRQNGHLPNDHIPNGHSPAATQPRPDTPAEASTATQRAVTKDTPPARPSDAPAGTRPDDNGDAPAGTRHHDAPAGTPPNDNGGGPAGTPPDDDRGLTQPTSASLADTKTEASRNRRWRPRRPRGNDPAPGAPPDGQPTAEPSQNGHGPSASQLCPDMLSDADTVMFPAIVMAPPAALVTTDVAEANADVATQPRPDEGTEIISAPATLLPAADDYRPEESYTPSRRRTMISRLVLLAILCLQAIMSLRLHNTAFEDEALYLYAGHMEIAHLLHGASLQGNYAAYFSGSPVLYPVLAAAVDSIGGLAAARGLSLLEMLATTALLYSLTRRLFNERTGLCAALLYSVTMSVIFLGNFATFDASCLFLLALAAWIVVRTALARWPIFLMAAPVAALAVATKYAGLMFVPTIALLPALTAWPLRRRRALLYPLAFSAAVVAILYGGLRLGGSAYLNAVQSTTTSRASGSTPLSTLLRESLDWGGLWFAVAVLGTVAYVWRPRTEPGEQLAPAGSRLRRATMGTILTGTALLAPIYQAHIHTDVSFQKHIGFGLFFAAPMAGVGLARIVGDHFRRPQLGIAVWCAALILGGLTQASQLYSGWPNSQKFTQTLAHYLRPGARYLVEVPEVPIYYLRNHADAQPSQFYSTFLIFYVDKQGKTLTGDAGFVAAVKQGYFQVIAYTGTITPSVDQLLGRTLRADPAYRLASVVRSYSSPYTFWNYYIWVKRSPVTHQRAHTVIRHRTATHERQAPSKATRQLES